MDVKKLGKIPDGGGWRAHGRGRATIGRSTRSRSATTTCTRSSMTTPGWRTPRSCPTRRARPARRSSNVPSTTSPPTASPASSELMTDNAWAYRVLRSTRRCAPSWASKQKFIRPHCPWQNGKVERLNRTLAHRMGLPPSLHSPTTHRAAALAPWLEHYNTRPTPQRTLGGDSNNRATATSRQPRGRFSYAVDSTIVVRVDTFAAERIAAEEVLEVARGGDADLEDVRLLAGHRPAGLDLGDRRRAARGSRRAGTGSIGVIEMKAVSGRPSCSWSTWAPYPRIRPLGLEPLHALVHGGGGQPGRLAQVGERHPPVGGEQRQDQAVGGLHGRARHALRVAMDRARIAV